MKKVIFNHIINGLIFCQILDAVSTYFAITLGKGIEANIIGDWIFTNIGLLPGLVIAKIFVIVCFLVGKIAINPKNWYQVLPFISLFVIYVFVVINNLLIVFL